MKLHLLIILICTLSSICLASESHSHKKTPKTSSTLIFDVLSKLKSVDELAKQKCKPCEGGVEPLTSEQAHNLQSSLLPNWQLIDRKPMRIRRKLDANTFSRALALINVIGTLAEGEGHHPDIHITSFSNVMIELSTFAIKGLSENDFILAAKIEEKVNLLGLK